MEWNRAGKYLCVLVRDSSEQNVRMQWAMRDAPRS